MCRGEREDNDKLLLLLLLMVLLRVSLIRSGGKGVYGYTHTSLSSSFPPSSVPRPRYKRKAHLVRGGEREGEERVLLLLLLLLLFPTGEARAPLGGAPN